MEYKYEKENKEAVMINPPKANRELQEVYRKAKAYDKLVEFYPQKDEVPSDEFFMMMGYIIKEDE